MRRSPFRHLIVAACIPAAGFALDLDSIDLFQYTLPLHMARALPVSGPEAAPANPARLSEADHWYARLGGAGAGRVSHSHTSAGVTFPAGFSVGLAGLAVTGRARGTNAVFLEQRAALQAAWMATGTAAGPGLSFGYALAWHGVNAWNIYKASAFTHDLGLVWRPSPIGPGWKPELGLTLRDLDPMDADIPDSNDVFRRYRLYGPTSDALIRISSPGGFVSGWISMVAGPRIPISEYYGPIQSTGSGIGGKDFEAHFHRYGIALRPAGFLAFRIENPGYSLWQAGATVGAGPLLRWRLEADAAVSKGSYYAYTRPGGSGTTFAWTVMGGW